ncbi:MAG: TolC family protein [Desulfocapsaceae bacterium]|nr:TolC family protein [Desulfocapsaceae bacterium]
MNMPIRFLVALLLYITMVGGVLAAQENNPSSTVLEELIGVALAGNPDLRATVASWRASESKIAQSGSLNDPTLTFSLNNYPANIFPNSGYDVVDKGVKLTQEFPFPGKLVARQEVAAQEASWSQSQVEEGRLQLVRAVKEAYYTLYYFDRAVTVTEKTLKILDGVILLTETKYQVGKGLQQDVLKAQLERSRMLDQLYAFKQQRESSQAALNRLVNRAPATPLASLPDFALTPIAAPLDELQSAAQKSRPMVAAYNSLLARYQAQQRLAKLDYRPDMMVSLSYMYKEPNGPEPGADLVGIEFGINLPIYREKRKAAVAESEAGEQMALAQYDEFKNQVSFNIHDAYRQMQTSTDQARLYKTGIIPQAVQTLESARGSYQVGKLEFLTLLDNLISLYNYELQYYMVLSDGERSLARLEAESGQTIPLAAQ